MDALVKAQGRRAREGGGCEGLMSVGPQALCAPQLTVCIIGRLIEGSLHQAKLYYWPKPRTYNSEAAHVRQSAGLRHPIRQQQRRNRPVEGRAVRSFPRELIDYYLVHRRWGNYIPCRDEFEMIRASPVSVVQWSHSSLPRNRPGFDSPRTHFSLASLPCRVFAPGRCF